MHDYQISGNEIVTVMLVSEEPNVHFQGKFI
jgi:hypothetical protein